MIAGSDRASTTATFTVLLLLKNQFKPKLLVSEINAAFPSLDGPITFAASQNLSYLNPCINGSMRLMPIVRNGLSRITEETIVLDGLEIPAGGGTCNHLHVRRESNIYRLRWFPTSIS
jgi:cytochrome P450